MKPQLSIVIPCYNEEKNIPLLVKRFNEVRPKSYTCELILVDNGSIDKTNSAIKNQIKKHKNIKLAVVKKNIGYGFGILTGLKKAGGRFVCWTHADMQTDLFDTVKAFNIIKKQKSPEKCFVMGKRKKRGIIDAFFTLGMSIFTSMVLGEYMEDINAQPKLFSRFLLSKAKSPPNESLFDLYFYYLAKKHKYKIIKFPVQFKKRKFGKSHWNKNLFSRFKVTWITIKSCFELRKRLK
jgi:polyisoprenyl-phosphate glycosyltransferase